MFPAVFLVRVDGKNVMLVLVFDEILFIQVEIMTQNSNLSSMRLEYSRSNGNRHSLRFHKF